MPRNKLIQISFIIVSFIFIIISVLYFSSVLSYLHFISILLPAIYTTAGFIITVLFIKKAEKQNNNEVIGTIFKGMGIRILVLILLVIISFKFLDINKISFIFSVLIFYIYYLTIEVIYLSIRK